MKVIEATDNFTRVLENIAGSVTDLLRLYGDTQITGQVCVSQAFVHVHWLWIALTLSLVFVGAIALAVTIYDTRCLKMAV
jgi:hypothetical protein